MSTVKLKTKWKVQKISCVYENEIGQRIHTYGLLRESNGRTSKPDWNMFDMFMVLTGGNRRRSLMACMESI